MLSEVQKRFIEYELCIASDADLVTWAVEVLEADAPEASNPDIVEIASLPAQPRLDDDAGKLLRATVRRDTPEFACSSAEAEAHAKETFRTLCARFVAGDVRPYQLCRVVSPIEQMFDYPSWIGDFPDHCDWCEPESKRAEWPALVQYAEVYLRETP